MNHFRSLYTVVLIFVAIVFPAQLVADIVTGDDVAPLNMGGMADVTTGRVEVGGNSSSSGTGTLVVNGGTVLTSTANRDISTIQATEAEPAGMIGRQTGSYGTVTVTGMNSTWLLEGTGLDSTGIYGPYLIVGREGGRGELNITGGGKVILDGLGSDVGGSFAANIKIGRNPAAGGSVLNIDGIDSEALITNIDHTHFRMGNVDSSVVNITNGGALTIGGHNSFSQIQWGTFNVNTEGTFTTNLMAVGGKENSNVVMNIDGFGSSIRLTGVGTADNEYGNNGFGGFMTVGRGANSSAAINVTNGAEINIDSGFGFAADGTPSSGSGFSLGGRSANISGQGTLNVESNAQVTVSGGGEFVGIGRNQSGSGTINVKSGGMVTIENNANSFGVFMAPTANAGIAELNVDGSDSLFDAGKVLYVGVDGGPANSAIANVTITNDGAVKADKIVVGGGGTISGDGSLIGERIVNNGGTIGPGVSPGTLTIDGNYEMIDGVLEIEIAGLNSGEFDLLDITGTANLSGGTILFSFVDRFLPQADDPLLEIITAGGGLTIGKNVNFAFQGVDESFELAVVAEDTGLRFDALNDALPPAGFVLIDIKPNSDPNCFNINGHGMIPVAILGNDIFDVTLVDQKSLMFGGLKTGIRGNGNPQCSVDYSDSDTSLDLVCQFEDDAASWNPGDGEATLTGKLLDGSSFSGTDSICVVQ